MQKTPLIVAALATLGLSGAGVLAYAPSTLANTHSLTLSSASSAAATGIVVAEDSDQSSDSGSNQPAPQQGDDQK